MESEPEAGPDGDRVTLPKLGPLGFLRFVWRLLTSMRTALVLLLLLALAAVPGSLVPQRSSDPNGVIAFAREDPDLFRVLDGLGLFSTFGSPWFSAIYLLLFISLIGCIVPRTKHHLDALLARPPKTPARLERLVGHTEQLTAADAETAIQSGRDVLRAQGYRVERYDTTGRGAALSVSAERGYLRETGNLVFHTALVGVLVSVAVGGLFGYTGQRVLVEGEPFTNVLLDYDSFHPGTLADADAALEPYSLRLERFDSEYQFDIDSGWHAIDFEATIGVRDRGGEWVSRSLKVNGPLEVGGTEIYLLGNGYAPIITVRDPDGAEVFSGPVPFIALDVNLRSVGVVKVPDGLADQVGMQGGFYPDPILLSDGSYGSFSPAENGDALLTLMVYRGDLGLDDGVPVNAYRLDVDELEELARREDALELSSGDTLDLPQGLGTVSFDGYVRYVSIDIHHDPARGWVLVFALLAVAGLLTSLFVPRRRLWVKVHPTPTGARLEYAGLARGEDAGLPDAVAELARRHRIDLERRMAP